MYLDEYKRWLAADLEDADLKPELSKIEGNDEEIKDRFAVALKFGTAGLRGVLGAGTNRMNIYVVRQATQGLANWVNSILCKNFCSANHTNITKISAFSIIWGFRAVRRACGSARALTSPLPDTIIGTIEYSAETGHFPGHFPVGPQTRREEAPCIPF